MYTASWAAPKSDVHSQQRFFYMGHSGEVRVDQAHRGYTAATDAGGFASCNPLFMKYTANPKGEFVGQNGYGYKSIEAFVMAVKAIREGRATVAQFDSELATIGASAVLTSPEYGKIDSCVHALSPTGTTYQTTAILEAGRRSLDAGGVPFQLVYSDAAAGGTTGAGGAGAGAQASAHIPVSIVPYSHGSVT